MCSSLACPYLGLLNHLLNTAVDIATVFVTLLLTLKEWGCGHNLKAGFLAAHNHIPYEVATRNLRYIYWENAAVGSSHQLIAVGLPRRAPFSGIASFLYRQPSEYSYMSYQLD